MFLGLSLSVWLVVLLFLIDLAIRIAAVIIVPRNRPPSSAMAWLLAVFFIPFLGVFLFLLIGNPRLPKKRRDKQHDINETIRALSTNIDQNVADTVQPPWFSSLVTLNRTLGAMPFTEGNSATLISEYQTSLDTMADAVRSARRFVHVEFYIFQADASTENFFRSLEEACQRGITVRVLLDHWANRGKPFYRQTLDRLTAMGAHWYLMLPVQPLKGKYQRPDLRNHRKLLVVDGLVAFTGSQNLTDSSYNLKKNIKRGLHWVDLMVRLEGPIVDSVNAVFLSDWYSETDDFLGDELVSLEPVATTGSLDCQVVPSGPGFDFENNLKLFLALLYSAQKKIIIVSPYFVPNQALLLAITTACHRGVHVELFVSEEGDQAMVYHAQRSYYEILLRAGVMIWMYRKPYILHTKCLSIDDSVAVIGSSNMDMRSFGLNMEISLFVRGEEFVTRMRGVEQQYRHLSRQLTLEEWMHRSLWSSTIDNLARLTSALQ